MARMTRLALIVFPTLLIGLSSIAPTRAQTRVFVAAHGSDGNPCTFALPCRTFQHAHDTVLANGEIDVLDPAGYGALTITKSISIQGHGFSGITTTSGTAIAITAGSGDKIHLQGLLIDGFGTALRGIDLQTGGSLDVIDCTVRHFGGDGIILQPSATSRVSIKNTIASDNGITGINVATLGPSSRLQATFSNVATNNNNFGINVNTTPSGARIMILNSESTNNSSHGIKLQGGAFLQIDGIALMNNGTSDSAGLTTHDPGDLVYLGRAISNDIINCSAGGAIFSFGDNHQTAFINGLGTCFKPTAPN